MARKGTTTFNGKTGVWRTVGGRRIFIATGQSLEEAMRASGKFKNIDKDIDPEESYQAALSRWNYARDHYDEDSKEYEQAKTDYEKSIHRKEEARNKKYTVDGKEVSELDLRAEYKKEHSRGNVTESYEDWKKSIVDDRNSNVKSSDSKGPGKIQKEFGLKDVRNEADVDGFINGNMDVEDFKFSMERGGESQETINRIIGNKVDTVDYDALFKGNTSSVKIGEYTIEGSYNYNPKTQNYSEPAKKVAVYKNDATGEVKYYINLDKAKAAIKKDMGL